MIKKCLLLALLLVVVGCTYDVVETTHVFDGNVNVTGNISFGSDISRGWVEYSDTVYNDTNRLTINTTRVNFSMINYTVRDLEKPIEIDTFFNGTHTLVNNAGDGFIHRWRYNAKPLGANTYCEVFNNIGLASGSLPYRLLTFPKGVNVEVVQSFTNFEYGLDTWQTNGGRFEIECSNSVEFWDIELTIVRIHKGRGVY